MGGYSYSCAYGLVSLEGEKLSSRNGNIIYAEDILNEAIERAYHLIEDKNPDLPDKEEAANKVGVVSTGRREDKTSEINSCRFGSKDDLGCL
nr:arginine--tRNA ligase [Lacrimispora celerecrescens]